MGKKTFIHEPPKFIITLLHWAEFTFPVFAALFFVLISGHCFGSKSEMIRVYFQLQCSFIL